MKLYQRYINGQEQEVYDELIELGDSIFEEIYISEVETILLEIFQRVRFNLEIIYDELENIGYLFKTKYECNSDKPFHKPLPKTQEFLKKLEDRTSPFGHIPLSIKYFYSLVGGVNFCWDYEVNKEVKWLGSDPIQIISLDDIYNYILDEYWEETMSDYLEDPEYKCAFFEISEDYLHKDNISGGMGYAIKLTKKKSLDSELLHESNNTTFINYLRICFANCGFSKREEYHYGKDFDEFYKKVKPKLLNI